MPMNTNTTGAKLREAFESLGFTNVMTVIASGNVIFDTPSKSERLIEAKIEKVLATKLSFTTTAIVRNKEYVAALIKKNPFKNVKDERPNYLVVTFFKNRDKELCTTLDLNDAKTPDFMRTTEKTYGKQITTRTWKTIHRIAVKMGM